ncbi:MAG: dihydroorotate dehydrogenase [Brevinema sp.]
MLSIKFLDYSLKNPLIAASGTFGFGENYQDFFPPQELGGIALKGLTPEARFGNEGIRLAETPSGMLNSIGLQNPGLEYFESVILPSLAHIDTLRIANINGKTIEDYELLASRADSWKEIEMIELNISCPNVKEGGMAFGTTPEKAAEITKIVKSLIKTKPLIVKLSPNASDIGQVAQAVEEAGADALSLINTLLGMAINIHTQKPILGNIFGGLSGPAVKPIALRMLWQTRQNSSLPILAGGGISSAPDALEFLMAGANTLAIGTAFFQNPLIHREILSGIEQYLKSKNLQSLKDIIGIAHI